MQMSIPKRTGQNRNQVDLQISFSLSFLVSSGEIGQISQLRYIDQRRVKTVGPRLASMAQRRPCGRGPRPRTRFARTRPHRLASAGDWVVP